MISRWLKLAMVFFIVTTALPASTAQFIVSTNMDDGFYSIGMTTNGTVRIVGARNGAGGFFEWAGGGFTFTPLAPLLNAGSARANGISADGTLIVGSSATPEVCCEATLWSAEFPNAPLGLGFLDEDLNFEKHSVAYGIANPGGTTIVVGQSGSSNGRSGFRWTSTNGITELPSSGLPTFTSVGGGITGDGGSWAGSEEPATPGWYYRAVFGSSNGVVLLDSLGSPNSGAAKISRDGTVIAGQINSEAAFWSGTNYAPTRITFNNAPLPGFSTASDGQLVVGHTRTDDPIDSGWIASVTNGVAQFATNWLAQHYGLGVTNFIAGAEDILRVDNRLFILFNTTAGGALFTTDDPPLARSLAVALLPSGEIELRWPTNQSCAVESTHNFTPPRVWTTHTNPAPTVFNGQFVLALSTTNAMSFFRLNCP